MASVLRGSHSERTITREPPAFACDAGIGEK
jgi:hypothetical protein